MHAAHELDHHYLQELFSGITGGARDSNNLIHYAGNVSYPYMYSRKAKYLTKAMWLKGEPVDGGLLGHSSPLDKYYAYGIRNSFGLDYDLL